MSEDILDKKKRPTLYLLCVSVNIPYRSEATNRLLCLAVCPYAFNTSTGCLTILCRGLSEDFRIPGVFFRATIFFAPGPR